MTNGEVEFDAGTLPELLKQLLHYWRSIKGSRAVPSRRDFDPIDIPKLLPHVILVEVLRDATQRHFEDFRFRLIGTYVEDRMRDRYTGLRLSEIKGKGPGSKVWETYTAVRQEKRPKMITQNYIGPMDNIKGTQEIFLPLSSNGSRVDFILVGLLFQ